MSLLPRRPVNERKRAYDTFGIQSSGPRRLRETLSKVHKSGGDAAVRALALEATRFQIASTHAKRVTPDRVDAGDGKPKG